MMLSPRHSRWMLAGLLAGMVTMAVAAPAHGLRGDFAQRFDARVNEVMRTHDVPGMAISIVDNGQVIHAQGYGVRQLGAPGRVDADTIFPTGSTGKAITAAALGILVDEGKLGWDDKVIDHLPDFRMYDPWVTREMTVRDLLVHRSGLGLGAGDLLFVPRTSRSRADIVHALRDIKPATSFRSGYAYDNILYIVAGQLTEAVAGQRWEDFVRERVFKPVGMTSSVSDENDRFANANRAQPHARLGGKVRGLGTQQVLPEREGLGQVGAPAGGLSSSANDLARWLQVQLGQGVLPGSNGKRLYSQAVARELWTPQIHVPIQPYPAPITDITPQFSGYALGWNVQDYRGVRLVQHGGAVFGVQTFIFMVPERNFGMSLQINSEDVNVMRGLMYEVLDEYLGFPPRDWVAAFDAWYGQRLAGGAAALDATSKGAAKAGRAPFPLAGYVGRYADPWYGPMAITLRDGKLRMDFQKTPNMAGTLGYWQYDTFRVDWDDASIEPAYVTFGREADGKVSRVTMKAVSPVADFSYDYQDLLFTPVSEGVAEGAAVD